MNKNLRVLVTGAGGFVGANLVRALRPKGAEIIAAIHHDRRRLAGLTDVTIAETDLRDEDSVRYLIKDQKPKVIINAAARGVKPQEADLDEMYAINVTGAWHLHRRATEWHCRHFVQLGTYFEFGDVDGSITEDTPSNPMSPYAATKAAATLLLKERAQRGTLPTTIMRLFDLWGPLEEPHRFVPSLIRACQLGKPFPMTGGEQVKDYTFICDAAAWISELAILPPPLPWPLLNVASGNRRLLRNFALEIACRLGRPNTIELGAISYRKNEPFSATANTSRLDTLLPLRKPTSVRNALIRMGVKW